MRITSLALATVFACLCGVSTQAAHPWKLERGTPDLKSAGQLAFGPDGILFVGDSQGAAVFAVDTGDATRSQSAPQQNVEALNQRLAELFGGEQVTINDLAVNPLSGKTYLSVSRGEAKAPAIVRVEAAGKLEPLSLKDVPFSKASLSSVPEDKVTGEGPRARNRRAEAITDLGYSEGKLLVAGLSGEAAPSTIREVPFPFADQERGTNVEIYHAAHGRVEDYAAVRTFVPMNIDGKPALLAGFTCTPLVRIPLEGVGTQEKVRGTTVAELGNRNTPLDMIVYEQNGQSYVLMANTARGVMKISTAEIGRATGLTEPVKGGGTAGQEFETIKDLDGTVQLDRLDDQHAVVIQQRGSDLVLRTVPLP